MSRISRKPIIIPNTVSVLIDDKTITIKSNKGSLIQKINPQINYLLKDGSLIIKPKSKYIPSSILGTTRTLLNNMVRGVLEEYVKSLELQGTGYRVAKEGENIKILVGFSHPVIVKPAQGIKFEVEGTNVIKVIGIDKQLVGQTAADIRAIKPPEPYKGKGIRYLAEQIKRKAGKAAKAGAAA